MSDEPLDVLALATALALDDLTLEQAQVVRAGLHRGETVTAKVIVNLPGGVEVTLTLADLATGVRKPRGPVQ